jgi:hypothetical protein
MKRLLATMFIAALGALAAPGASDAAVSCHPVVSIDTSLSITGGRCALAHRLERYVSTHQSLDGSFFALRRQWLGAANRAGTKFVYDSPGWPTIEIRITSRLQTG